MKFTTVAGLSLVTTASAVDMRSYKPSSAVEDGFATFIQEFYKVSEDKKSTTAFTNFWPKNGEIVLAGNSYQGTDTILAVKQRLLPPDGNKEWWHLIREAEVLDSSVDSKTYRAEIVIQTTYTPGNCSQARGTAAFTLSAIDGKPNLIPHTQSLLVYSLAVSTTKSPTDEPCESV